MTLNNSNSSSLVDDITEPDLKRVRTDENKTEDKVIFLEDCLKLISSSLASEPVLKRVYTSGNNVQNSDLVDCLKLLNSSLLPDQSNHDEILPKALKSIFRADPAGHIGQLRAIFKTHGFRTSIVSYPHVGLSIYKDSCVVIEQNEEPNSVALGKKFLLFMLGLHPNQESIEHCFTTVVRDIYCTILFCNRILELIGDRVFNKGSSIVSDITGIRHALKNIVSTINKETDSMIQSTFDSGPSTLCMNHTLIEQLKKFTSMIPRLFCNVTKNERITIFLYDPEVDKNISKPTSFTLIPSLCGMYKHGLSGVTATMVTLFWKNMLELGYFASDELRKEISPEIEKYFLSGLMTSKNMPILLNAHFTPTYPLSLYLFGEAGAGKSSFVSFFHFALNQTINHVLDPSLNVQFVKQNLNKRQYVLETEFELRPNNNDMSIMSIIQGRRMAFKQRKPGLVVIGLEEMPRFQPDGDPNQLQLAQLLSQRFAGRLGNFKGRIRQPKNSDRRGISGDASLICIFTSNYKLEPPCADALKQLDMFSNMKQYQVKAISGIERSFFAQSYFSVLCRKKYSLCTIRNPVELKITVGEGDTRQLVQKLKILSYFVKTCVSNSIKNSSKYPNIIISEDSKSKIISICDGDNAIELKSCRKSLFSPLFKLNIDDRVSSIMKELQKLQGNFESFPQASFVPLVLDMFFSRTLGPTVIVSKDGNLIKNIFLAVARETTVHSIANLDPLVCKMTKSLYDKKDTPNLRDKILKFGKNSFVTVHIRCKNLDSQLCIREMIEDSPSMSAFSTSKSALHKTGLLFCIHVESCITPEIKSRASILLEN